ncbi:MAG TPA: L,D-transpeptidase family protein [Candidatus Binatia bacterium]|nr:L,D-transpeptidase family protein [Candidatus Binatia bacterium]
MTVAIATLLNGPEVLVVDGQRLDARALRQLYEPRGYRPVWAGGEDASERASEIADALAHASAHGLEPATYHQQAIARRASDPKPAGRASLDVLASDGLIRLIEHLRTGAVRPESLGGDIAVESRPVDAQALVLEAAAATDLSAFLDGLAPQTETYRGLMEALARYREIARTGAWPVVPVKGPTVRPGESDPSIPIVRARLAKTGEYPDVDPEAPTLYDDALATAVKAFQARHGVTPDAALGAATRAALAVPVEERIGQLRANLERARWFSGEPGSRYVAVNVPSYDLVLVEDGSTVLKMPVVVGRKDRPTPVLGTYITELIFNPTWTVPPTLLRQDFLPKMQRNPGYLAKRGLQVVSSRSLTLRQPPGPKNPLGRVKFLMPNPFSVYLHDTTSKGLMREPRRAMSSGCVRLGDALGLANRLLADDPRWTPAVRKQFLTGWTTRYVALREPVPVYLRYQTAWQDGDNGVQFREDVYGRDAELARALAPAPKAAKAVTPSA